ncbi:MAG TPA: response regulator [Thermomicrobiales bacterium]|nr:response regulator [Thermomicrobiales bacterium]
MRMQAEKQQAVLVVDDDAAVRDLVATVLRDAGYAVRTAADGLAALRLLDRYAPAVVVLDVQMPGLDGLSTCARLRRADRTARLPVVLISARPVAARQLAACRVNAFLPKPFDIAELVDEVDRWARPAA